MIDASYQHLDQHLRDEAQFADREYSRHAATLGAQDNMFQKYAAPTAMWDWRQFAAHLLGDISGKKLLDYGCGMGEESTYFAKLGADVTAFDISEVGVRLTNARAAHNGVGDRVHARLLRAEDTHVFADASFDIVHGLGILHHVDLARAMSEVKRLLVPGGTAIFLEPMGNSPTVEAIKGWLMRHSAQFTDVTDHEENLKLDALRAYQPEFSRLDLHPFHLLYRAKKFFPASSRDRLRQLDHRLLGILPRLGYFAGAVVIHIRK